MCLSIRIGADKCRQKRVVDIDNARGISIHQLGREDLHVPSQDHEIDLLFIERSQNGFFLSRFSFWCDWQVQIWNAHMLHKVGVVGVIVDDRDDVGW